MLGLLGVGGSSSQSPSAAGTHTAAFCSTQSPCPSPGVAAWASSSAAESRCGDMSLSSQSTHRLGVWARVTRLASCLVC